MHKKLKQIISFVIMTAMLLTGMPLTSLVLAEDSVPGDAAYSEVAVPEELGGGTVSSAEVEGSTGSESDAARLLEEKAGLSRETAAGAASLLFGGAASAEAQGAAAGTLPDHADGNQVDSITAVWITPDTQDAETPEPDDPNLLYLAPEAANPLTAKLQINYSLSGEYNYEPGDITIKIPAQIFRKKDRSLTGGMILPLPENPSTEQDYNWKLDNGTYVITNTKRLSAATKGYMQFDITGILPYEILDMDITNDFAATIEVVTHRGNLIGQTSNAIKAQINTKAKVENAHKNYYTNPEIVPENQVPLNNLVSGETLYVKVGWYAYAYITASGNYDLVIRDTLSESPNGTIRDYTDETTKRTVERSLANSHYNGETNYYYYESYYPFSQFEAGQEYDLENDVVFELVEVDHKDVPPEDPDYAKYHSSTAAEKIAPFNWTEPSWDGPGPGYRLVKNGNDGKDAGNLTRHLSDNKVCPDLHLGTDNYFGIYPTALNKLEDKENVEISYTIHSYANVLKDSYVADPIDPDSERKYENYFKHDITVVSTDNGMRFGRNSTVNLTPQEDYIFKSIEFAGEPVVQKAVLHNVNPDGTIDKTQLDNASFVFESADKAGWPDITLQIQRDGAWEDWATASWKRGFLRVTRISGETNSNPVVNVPSETENFRTVVKLGGDGTTRVATIGYDVRPVVELKPTDKISEVVTAAFAGSNAPSLSASNGASMQAFKKYGTGEQQSLPIASDGQGDTLISEGLDSLRGYKTEVEVMPEKTAKFDDALDVDEVKGLVTVHYQAKVEERTVIHEKKTYEQAVEDGRVTSERTGTWYDLLPAGMNPLTDTIKLRNGDSVLDVRVIPHYKGSERTMLIVKTQLNNQPESYMKGDMYYYEDIPTISFDATYDFKSIAIYGNEIHNVIAFESGNDHIGEVENYSGEPDDPTAGNHTATKDAFDQDDPSKNAMEKRLMTGLDPNSNNKPRFVYAGEKLVIDVPMAAETELSKEVQVNRTGVWTTGLGTENTEYNTVWSGGSYQYRLAMSSEKNTVTKNMILYDILENFYASAGNEEEDIGAPRWEGSLLGVDVQQLAELGCAPEVYYSTLPKNDLKLETAGQPEVLNPAYGDLSNPSVWTKASAYTGDLSAVTAIAVDARKKTDGSDFELGGGDSLAVYISMLSPFVGDADPAKQEAARQAIEDNAHAYNNVYFYASSYNKESGEATDTRLIRKDYTKVALQAYEIEVAKQWSDDNDRDGMRPNPAEATVTLVQNGVPMTEKTITLDEGNGFKGKFDGIPLIDPGTGEEYHYTFEETPIPGYHPSFRISGNKVVINNIHTPEKVTISGTKTWVGDEGHEDQRPDYITVNLFADGVFLKSAQVRAPWNYEFTGLNKYENGREIVYTVEEDPVGRESYLSTRDGNNFINTYHPYGDLEVKKITKNTTDAAKNKEFPLTFTFWQEDGEEDVPVFTAFAYSLLDETETVIGTGTVQNGQTINIKGGQTIRIRELPENLQYKIEEEQQPGFTLQTSSNLSGEIRPNQVTKAELTNAYEAVGEINFSVEKTLTGRALDRYQFRFEVGDDDKGAVLRTASNGDPDPSRTTYTDDTRTTVASSTAPVNFGTIRYTQADIGVHHYTIRELSDGKTGYAYDNSEYHATVTVSDNEGNGVLQTAVTYTKGDTHEPVAGVVGFTNRYEAKGSTTLLAWKTLAGRDLRDGEFAFELYNEAETLLWTATNAADGTIRFAADPADPNDTLLVFDQTDIGKTYRYRIKERVPAEVDPTVEYSTAEFWYQIVVGDNGDGTLDIQQKRVKSDGSGGWTEEGAPIPVFNNGLQPGGLSVSKLKAEGSADGANPADTFRFKIRFIGETLPESPLNYNLSQITGGSSSGGTSGGSSGGAISGEPSGDAVSGETTEDPSGGAVFGETTEEPADGAVFGEMAEEPADGSGFGETTEDPAGDAAFWDAAGDSSGEITSGEALEGPVGETGSVEMTERTMKTAASAAKPAAVGANIAPDTTERAAGTAASAAAKRAPEKKTSLTWWEKLLGVTEVQAAEDDIVPATEYAGIHWRIDKDGVLILGLDGHTETLGEHSANIEDWPWHKSDTQYYKQITSVKIEGTIIANGSLANMFRDLGNLGNGFNDPAIGTINLEGLDTSNVTNMSAMFYGCRAKNIEFDENFKTNLVTDMSSMFDNCIKVESLDLSSFDTSSVRNMYYMFAYCNRTTSITLGSNFTTENVTGSGVVGMFLACTSLANLDFSQCTLDVSHATSLFNMFASCSSLTSLDLGQHFDTSNITNFSQMFADSGNLTSITFGNKFNTSNGTNMKAMFRNCPKLTSLDISAFNSDTSNTNSVTDMSEMFSGCKGLTDSNLNLGNLDTRSVTDMHAMFKNCEKLTSLDTSVFNSGDSTTANVTNMAEMFSGCKGLTSLNLGNLNTSSVTDMHQMFYNCSALQALNLGNSFNTSNVKDMKQMFSGCSTLQSIILGEHFDTSNVQSVEVRDPSTGSITYESGGMDYMFNNCALLTTIKTKESDTTNTLGVLFNTPKVSGMKFMFYGCSSLPSLDLGSIDIANATVISMFDGCTNLKSLSFPSLGTPSDVTNPSRSMVQMFNGCEELETLLLGDNFNTTNVNSMFQMFNNCKKLSTIKTTDGDTGNNLGSLFNTGAVINMSQMFKNCNSLPKIDLGDNFDTGNVTDLGSMFDSCSALTELDLKGSFDTSKVLYTDNMFKNCGALTTLNLGDNFNTSTERYKDPTNPDAGTTLPAMTDMFDGDSVLKEIYLPAVFRFNGESSILPTPPEDNTYTGKWTKEDDLTLVMTAEDLRNTFHQDTTRNPGTWVWQEGPNMFNLQFDKNASDASGSMSPVRISALDDNKIDPNAFYRFNYEFVGWATSPDGAKVYDDRGQIDKNTYNPGDTITLYAKWEQIKTEVNLVDGVGEFTLHANEKATFNDLPAGLAYQIWEETPDGWVLVSQSGTSGIIQSQQVAEASFSNRYVPGATTAQFSGAKTLDGKAAAANAFTFTLYEVIAGTEVVKQTKQTQAGGFFQFDAIPYTRDDIDKTFTYKIKEVVSGADDTLDWDTHEETITVKIEENDDGTPHAKTTYDAGLPDNTNGVLFENTTKPGKLKLSKTAVNATAANKDAVFPFEILLTNANGSPLSDDAVTAILGGRTDLTFENGLFKATLKAGQSITLTNIPAGTKYHIEEGTLPSGWAQQGSAGADGSIVAGAESASTFTNRYSAEGIFVPEVHKRLIGKTPRVGEFSFALYDEDPETPDAEILGTIAGNEALDTAEKISEYDAEGKLIPKDNPWVGTAPVYFTALRFTQEVLTDVDHDGTLDPATRTYYIKEIAGPDDKINFDARVIRMTLTIKDAGKGLLSVTPVYEVKEGSTWKTTDPEFVNSMKEGSLIIQKNILNATERSADTEFPFLFTLSDAVGNAINGEYDYTLQHADPDAPDTTGKWKTGEEMKLKGGDVVTVNGLPHGASYQVTENLEGDNGWTQVGKIADTGTIGANETRSSTITNSYRGGGQAQLEAKKTFAGGSLEDHVFTFELIDNTNNEMEQIQTARTDKDGKILFAPIYYDSSQDGETFTYYIHEIANEEDTSIHYDSAYQMVTVTVEDKGDGTVETEVAYPNGRGPAEFKNFITRSLSVSKEVTGSFGSQEQDFAFTLTLSGDQPFHPVTWTKRNTEGVVETGMIASMPEDGGYPFFLKHDETMYFEGITIGTEYSVLEVDANKGGYETNVTEGTVSGTLTEDKSVKFRNDRDADVPTGRRIGVLTGIALILIAAGGVSLVILLRRRRRAEHRR